MVRFKKGNGKEKKRKETRTRLTTVKERKRKRKKEKEKEKKKHSSRFTTNFRRFYYHMRGLLLKVNVIIKKKTVSNYC